MTHSFFVGIKACRRVNGSNPLFYTPKEKAGMKYFTFLPFYLYTP